MAIDTQTLAGIGDSFNIDVVGAKGKALSIKDMMDREQLSKLALTEKKSDMEINGKVQALLKGENVDYSNPEGVMRTAQKINQISPKAAMQFQSEAQKYTSGKVQAEIDQFELMDHHQNLVVSTIDPIVAQARQIQQQSGAMAANAFVQQQLPTAMETLRNTKLPNGQSALSQEMIKEINDATTKGPIGLSTLESWENKTKQGQAFLKQRLEQLKADTGFKREQETERHNRATEDNAIRRTTLSAEKDKAKAAGYDDRESDLLASLAEKNVSIPAGLRSQAQIKSTVDGLLRRHPEMSTDEIAEGIKSGKLKLAAETKAAQGAGGQIGKVALAANELDTFGDQVIEASKAVPRGTFVPYEQLRQKGEGSISDPNLLRFKAKMQALENAYNQLAARSGTDVEKRAHIHELFNTANSDAAVNTLVKAVKEEAVAARIAADATIGEVSGAGSIPGAGGPATGAHPPDIQSLLNKYAPSATP